MFLRSENVWFEVENCLKNFEKRGNRTRPKMLIKIFEINVLLLRLFQKFYLWFNCSKYAKQIIYSIEVV